MREEITRTFQSKIFALNKEDPTYEARKEYFENKMNEELDAVDSFEKKNKNRRKRKFQNIDEKIADCLDPRKTKMIAELPKVSEIINDFLSKGDENYKDLRNNLCQYKNISQHVYSNFFPEIYCSPKRRGFSLKSNFHIIFKTYKDKKKMEASLGKNPNYEEIRD